MKIELSREMRHKSEEQATGKRMLLGVRPQHMLLQHAGQSQANGRNILSGTVYVAEPLGTEQLVRVRVGSELVQVLTGDQVQVAMDEPVLLEVPPDRFFLFDAESEKRIA